MSFWNSCNCNGLSPVTNYSFYLVAKDAAGNSSNQSNSVTGETTIITSSCATKVSKIFRLARHPMLVELGLEIQGSIGLQLTRVLTKKLKQPEPSAFEMDL